MINGSGGIALPALTLGLTLLMEVKPMISTLHPCPPCFKTASPGLSISASHDPLSLRSKEKADRICYLDPNLFSDLDYLKKQQRILDWVEASYPRHEDAWCGLTTRQMAKRWKVSISTVSRWRRQWEAEGLIQTARVGRRTYLKAGRRISDVTRNLPI